MWKLSGFQGYQIRVVDANSFIPFFFAPHTGYLDDQILKCIHVNDLQILASKDFLQNDKMTRE